MKKCKFEDKVIDYLEGQLLPQDLYNFEKHLPSCELCQNEIVDLKNLYKVLENDEIPIPEPEFFDNLKIKIRQRKITCKKHLV